MGQGILVVEDDEAIRELLKFALQLRGYSVHTAGDGRAALDCLSKIPRPRLILLDMMMPILNGWAFMQSLRSHPQLADLPVVVLTAFQIQSVPTEVREVLRKPVDLEVLYTTVDKYASPTTGGPS